MDKQTLEGIAEFGVGEFIIIATFISSVIAIVPIVTAMWWRNM